MSGRCNTRVFPQIWRNAPRNPKSSQNNREILVNAPENPFSPTEHADDAVAYVSLLKNYAQKRDLAKGTELHSDILSRHGLLEFNPFIGSSLINLYAKCGELSRARQVHDQLHFRNVVCWNAIISGYAQHGHGEDALLSFDRMQMEGFFPNAITLTSVLKACGSEKAVNKGKRIHEAIVRQGLLDEDNLVGNAMVDMYARFGMLVEAEQVLNELPVRDEAAWNTIISGYSKQRHHEEALTSFEKMQIEGLLPNSITFTCVLKACGSILDLDKGKQIHDVIASNGLLAEDVALGNALLDMYATGGALSKMEDLFEGLPSHDAVSWNVLISAYAREGQCEKSLHCFELMQLEGVHPDILIFTGILKACGSMGAVRKGKEVHNEVVNKGLPEKIIEQDTVLVNGNGRCTAFAAGCEDEDGPNPEHDKMQTANVPWRDLVSTCKSTGLGTMGDVVLSEKQVALRTALVDMYARCGAVEEARKVHDDLPVKDAISWNALISGYVQREQNEEALNCFKEMQDQDVCPNEITFTCVLRACACIGMRALGQSIHDEILLKKRLLGDDIALGSALLGMYTEYGAFAKARQVLDGLPVRSTIPWAAMITGYVQHGQNEEALSCFQQMKNEGISPNPSVFASLLKACSSTAKLDKGKQIHNEILHHHQGLLEHDVVLGSALVDMYTKCGALSKAQELLHEFPPMVGNVVAWSALVAGYGLQGQVKDALDCFRHMQNEIFTPNSVTFLSILNACSHAGLVEEGQMYFDAMVGKHGILPNSGHYTCMVDLFGRAGHLELAMAVIEKMPSPSYIPVWTALLAACRKWGNVELGRLAFERAVRLDCANDAVYSCMINIYADACMLEHAQEVREMRERGGRTHDLFI